MSKDYLDKAGALYMVTKTKAEVDKKVTKVEGKGLSTNDFTNELKSKVENMDTTIAAAVSEAVGSMQGISYSVVASLPSTGEAGTIYLLANDSGENSNNYDEYIWVNGAFEKIGTTAVDLSGYVKETDLVPISNAEIDAMFQ